MSAVTASLCSTLMFVLFVSADQKNITAVPGQDITLTCRTANNNIIVVKWSRADLGDEYVLLYRDDQLDLDNLHPSFKNRVDLQDRQMKDGDVSLILKNVTINDAGTYECHVFMEETRSWELSIIHLHVGPPGQTRGHTEDGGKKEEGSVGLIVVTILVIVIGVSIFLIRRKNKPHKKVKTTYQQTRKPSQTGQDVNVELQTASQRRANTFIKSS